VRKSGGTSGEQTWGQEVWLEAMVRAGKEATGNTQGTTRAVIEQGGQSEFVGCATHLPNIALGPPAPARAADLEGEVGVGG
jgi:hypothetical protein